MSRELRDLLDSQDGRVCASCLARRRCRGPEPAPAHLVADLLDAVDALLLGAARDELGDVAPAVGVAGGNLLDGRLERRLLLGRPLAVLVRLQEVPGGEERKRERGRTTLRFRPGYDRGEEWAAQTIRPLSAGALTSRFLASRSSSSVSKTRSAKSSLSLSAASSTIL